MRVLAVVILLALTVSADARFPRGVGGVVSTTCGLADSKTGNALTDVGGNTLVVKC